MAKLNNNATALVMCIANATGNPRPNRIIRLLAENGFIVDLLAFPHSIGLPVRRTYPLTLPDKALHVRFLLLLYRVAAGIFAILCLNSFAEFIYELRHNLRKLDKSIPDKIYDIVIVEDIQLLPFAFRKFSKSQQTNIVFDAREFYPKQNEEKWLFRLFEKPIRNQLCSEYLPRCNFLITVSPGLARAYQEQFGVKIQILRSTPYYQPMQVKPTPNDKIRMVHHGMANPNRGLANMIEVVRRLDKRFTLDLFLVGDFNHIELLRKQAKDCDRIQFKKPVLFNEIIRMLNAYDIGFYYLEPNGFNVKCSLPNKFFEFIQARLAIAIGPSPDMSEILMKYGLGFIAPDFSIDSMVKTLSILTSQKIDLAKQKSDEAAKELCYEKESEFLINWLSTALNIE